MKHNADSKQKPLLKNRKKQVKLIEYAKLFIKKHRKLFDRLKKYD